MRPYLSGWDIEVHVLGCKMDKSRDITTWSHCDVWRTWSDLHKNWNVPSLWWSEQNGSQLTTAELGYEGWRLTDSHEKQKVYGQEEDKLNLVVKKKAICV